MRFPRQRIAYSRIHDGKPSAEGYIVLDLKGFDLEGVTSLAIDAADIEACRQAGDKADAEKQRVRDLLGGP
jgi:hypothetical protein